MPGLLGSRVLQGQLAVVQVGGGEEVHVHPEVVQVAAGACRAGGSVRHVVEGAAAGVDDVGEVGGRLLVQLLALEIRGGLLLAAAVVIPALLTT